MLPEGWDAYVPNASSASSGGDAGKAQGGARRLAGHLTARLLRNTLRPVNEHGNALAQPSTAFHGHTGRLMQSVSTAHRTLLDDAEPLAGAATPERSSNCPPRLNYDSATNNLTEVAEEHCMDGSAGSIQGLAAAERRAAAERADSCAVTVKLAPGGSAESDTSAGGSGDLQQPASLGMWRDNHTIETERSGQECRFPATTEAELDSRDGAKLQQRSNRLSLTQPVDFWSRLKRLVEAVVGILALAANAATHVLLVAACVSHHVRFACSIDNGMYQRTICTVLHQLVVSGWHHSEPHLGFAARPNPTVLLTKRRHL
jgi:hypothetical protein